MTIKDSILKYYFERQFNEFIVDCLEDDVDYDNDKLKESNIKDTKEILAMRGKALSEYIDGFFGGANIDPNIEMGVDNSLAAELLMKCLTGAKNEG